MALVLALAAAQAVAGVAYLSADGYRERHYRAPTPRSVPGAVTLDTPALQRLLREQSPVLVDVQPVTVRPESREFGAAWLPAEPRHNLPGSLWLPNVGYAALTQEMERYLTSKLERATGGDRDRPLVFYCVADCWMSWNAVQRAGRIGYRRLYWYRDGTDGWRAHGLTLEAARPEPLD